LVFYRTGNKWHRHILGGRCFGFASLRGVPKWRVERFVQDVKQHRILGNCCVLICGESNGVPYHQNTGVRDDFNLRRSLPKGVTVVLNPVHDWMSRHEMKKKRCYLSENNRWVISVWNRGKRDTNGKRRDATGPPWTVFHAGREIALEPRQNQIGVDIGIVEIRRPTLPPRQKSLK
jgi:hypothetical protein